jgi:hypothetical protein
MVKMPAKDIYHDVNALIKDYELYLAIKNSVFNTFFQSKSIQAVIQRHQINLIVFNNKKEEIVSWIKS